MTFADKWLAITETALSDFPLIIRRNMIVESFFLPPQGSSAKKPSRVTKLPPNQVAIGIINTNEKCEIAQKKHEKNLSEMKNALRPIGRR